MPSDSEKNNGAAPTETGENCVACHSYFDKTDECDGNYVPLTQDEETILARMREVKSRVSHLKKQLNELESRNGFHAPEQREGGGGFSEDQVLWMEQTHQMEALRKEWQELDNKLMNYTNLFNGR